MISTNVRVNSMNPIKVYLSLFGTVLLLLTSNNAVSMQTDQDGPHKVLSVRIAAHQVAEVGWEKIRVEHDFGAPPNVTYKDVWIRIYVEILDQLRHSKSRVWSVNWIVRFGDRDFTEPKKAPYGFQASLSNEGLFGLVFALPGEEKPCLAFYSINLNQSHMDPLPPRPGSYDKLGVHYRLPEWKNFTTIPDHQVPLKEKLTEALGREPARQLLTKDIRIVALHFKDEKWTLVAGCGPYVIELSTSGKNSKDWRLEKLIRKGE